MRKRLITLPFVLAALLLLCSYPPPPPAAAVGPPNGIMRIGLYYGADSMPGANLQNVTGSGSGYEFGFFNSAREFVPIGAYTDEVQISMLRDVNMYYSATNTYLQGTESNVVVGCFHIILPGSYDTYAAALETAAAYADSYVKYDHGAFRVCVGNYTTRTDANAAIQNRGLSHLGAGITEGTSRTIAVVATGTNRVIFEFDYGETHNLAVRPRPSNENLPQTWFRGFRYYGAFEYSRPTGEDLTVINFVNIDDYIKGVVPNEMGPNWHIEALKVQAMCARTYAATKLNQHGSRRFDLCTEEHCQRYLGVGTATENSNRAADETAGMYITYNGQLCETYYSASSGGATENIENVWNESRPYLIGVLDPYEADIANRITNYYWTVSYSPAELTARLNGRGHNLSTVASVSVREYSPVGNAISVQVRDVNGRTVTVSGGENIRNTFGLPSIRFALGGAGVTVSDSLYIYGASGIETVPSAGSVYVIDGGGYTQEVTAGTLYAVAGEGEPARVGVSESTGGSPDGLVNGRFTFNGTGRGHNVGMSQWGALSLAEMHGWTAEEIIKFYYTGVEITRMYYNN